MSRTEPVLLSGGNPQIPKGDGDAPVQAYLAAMPGWKQPIGRRVDTLIAAAIPDVAKAVKWNSPFWGLPGRGWFASMHCFNRYVRITFFQGASLEPQPAGLSKYPAVRYLDLHEDDAFTDAQLTDWFVQASKLPGEKL